MKCILVHCETEALPGDYVCRFHAMWFRRPERLADSCWRCGRRLRGPFALARGECLDCDERAADEAACQRERWAEQKRERRRRVRTGRLPGPGPGGSMEP